MAKLCILYRYTWGKLCWTISRTFMFRHFLQQIDNFPNLLQMVPKGPQSIPKHVRRKSEKCPKMSENLRKIVRNVSQTYPKFFKNLYDEKSLPVVPGIYPGTLRIRLQPLSVSNPIGLIPSQQIGSPELSYVSELETKTHRNNLVAEKVTWAFSKLKKALF